MLQLSRTETSCCDHLCSFHGHEYDNLLPRQGVFSTAEVCYSAKYAGLNTWKIYAFIYDFHSGVCVFWI
jgi:hypothetical protein